MEMELRYGCSNEGAVPNTSLLLGEAGEPEVCRRILQLCIFNTYSGQPSRPSPLHQEDDQDDLSGEEELQVAGSKDQAETISAVRTQPRGDGSGEDSGTLPSETGHRGRGEHGIWRGR